ncbi:MAG: ABC transporter ATP-binding protein [Anaerolineales bacterium]|nr:ABC transporter ATP-binding protein [Anaerolineales bacterium]
MTLDNNVAIHVEGLGKEYRIGKKVDRYRTLRDTLGSAAKAPIKRAMDLLHGQAYGAAGLSETIWALKGVSFEVKHGEVLGIIGSNGAGKSTLLKILSRITEPTEGYADIYGRVGSLLEVGTGFHQELTGRENIYLNGAILGMPRVEIDRKFDEIVAFSGVEEFIDTPIKHYSSGMGLRLGFAVAAHLEPEILVVDEVLAVGDAAFQKKCLGKMSEVAQAGRTVLFVSHNMVAVQGLCQSAIVLDHGRVVFQGETQLAIDLYLQNAQIEQRVDLTERTNRKGDQTLRFVKVRVMDKNGQEIDRIVSGQDVYFRLYYTARKSLKSANILVSMTVQDQHIQLLNFNSEDTGDDSLDVYPEGYFECEWKNFNLLGGEYQGGLFCSINGQLADWVEAAFRFEVVNGDFFGTGKLLVQRRRAKILVPHYWISRSIE